MPLCYAAHLSHVQKLKEYLYLRPVSVFNYRKFNSSYYVRFKIVFWSLNCASQVCKFYALFLTIFLDSVDIGSNLVVTYFENWILTLGYFFSCSTFNFFWSVNYISRVSKTVKTFTTQEWLVVESCPTSLWTAILMFYRLVCNILSHLS